jgi:hypothetical protein
MSIVPPARSKRANILERLARGETVDEIARAEATSPYYVYNVKSKEKRKRASSENASPSISTPIAEDLNPEAAQTGRVPLEPTISSAPPVADIVTGTFPLAISIEDPVSDEIRLNMTETSNRLMLLRQRSALAHQNLQLSMDEMRVRAELLETRIRQAIVHECPDTRDMFANQNLYTESMITILENVEPFKTLYRRIVDSQKAHGLGVAFAHQTDASRLRACLRQSFEFIDAFGLNARSSGTPLRDHVIRFLRGIVNPDGYCPFDCPSV